MRCGKKIKYITWHSFLQQSYEDKTNNLHWIGNLKVLIVNRGAGGRALEEATELS